MLFYLQHKNTKMFLIAVFLASNCCFFPSRNICLVFLVEDNWTLILYLVGHFHRFIGLTMENQSWLFTINISKEQLIIFKKLHRSQLIQNQYIKESIVDSVEKTQHKLVWIYYKQTMYMHHNITNINSEMSHSPSCFGRERGLLGYPTAGLFLLHHLLHAAPWCSSLVLQAVLYGFQISAHFADDSEGYTRNDDNDDYEDVTDEISHQNARRRSYNNPWKDNRWNQVFLHPRPFKNVLTISICFNYLHVISSHFSLSLSTYLHCVHMR